MFDSVKRKEWFNTMFIYPAKHFFGSLPYVFEYMRHMSALRMHRGVCEGDDIVFRVDNLQRSRQGFRLDAMSPLTIADEIRTKQKKRRYEILMTWAFTVSFCVGGAASWRSFVVREL